ncbi:MAG: recombinase RecT [Acidovorax sp.]|jgi:recombination protein RecT|nr:recombinase RecT [Acidovorax sp.]
MSNAIQVVSESIYALQPAFEAVQIDKSITFAREAEFAIQILSGNDYAMGIAQSNRQSVADAVTNVSAIGITLNPAEKKAYLVPRKGGICLAISHIGLLHLAIESGSIRWGQARLVYENDHFELNGLDRQPTHTFKPFCKERGEIVGVYVSVKTADGDYLTEAMSTDEVNAIRDRSDAWKSWVSKKKSCPWVTDWGEMAKKTAVHRGHKYWPKTERLDKALHYLNTDGGEGASFNAKSDTPEKTLDPSVDIAEVYKTKTDTEALAYWKANQGKYKDDLVAHGEFKTAVVDHRMNLKAQGITDVEAKA